VLQITPAAAFLCELLPSAEFNSVRRSRHGKPNCFSAHDHRINGYGHGCSHGAGADLEVNGTHSGTADLQAQLI
jgi:hypothetical protein